MVADDAIGIDNFEGIPAVYSRVELFRFEMSSHANGVVHGVRAMDESGNKFYLVDTDNDGSFNDETIQSASETEPLTIRYTGDNGSAFQTEIEIFPGESRDEYAFRQIWTTTLNVGQESLPVGIAHFGGDASLMFGDADQDGSFEKLLNTDIELALGGSFWNIDVDFDGQKLVLRPGSGRSMTVGAVATDLDLEVDIDLDKPTLFTFCYASCTGCSRAMPVLEEIWASDGVRRSWNFVNVVVDEDEMKAAREKFGITFTQTVQPDLWDQFGVTPTPTLVVIDEEMVVRYRGNQVDDHLRELITGNVVD